jgi:hypothetical protein
MLLYIWTDVAYGTLWMIVDVIADICGHGGSVGIATRYGLDDLGFESRCV